MANPNETMYKMLSIPRWQMEWIRNHKSINCSGLLQESIIQIIKEREPEYYQKYIALAEKNIRRKETTPIAKIISN